MPLAIKAIQIEVGEFVPARLRVKGVYFDLFVIMNKGEPVDGQKYWMDGLPNDLLIKDTRQT